MFPSFLAWLSASAFAVRLGVIAAVIAVLVAGGCVARRARVLEPRLGAATTSAPIWLVAPFVALPSLTSALIR